MYVIIYSFTPDY